MQSIPTDRASKLTFWQRQFAKFQNAKTSNASQFCREQGLPYKSFMSWQRKLQSKPAVSSPQPKNFVQLQAPNAQPNTITCKLPNGLEFSWDTTTPPSTIAAVIQEVSQL